MLSIYHRTIKDPKLETIPTVKVGCWINVVDPTRDEINFLVSLGLQAENIDDALDPDELPRMESKENWIYVILNVPYDDGPRTRSIPLMLVLAPDFLVTVCKQPVNMLNVLMSEKNTYTTQKAKNLLQLCLRSVEAFTQKIRKIDKGVIAKRLNLAHLSDQDIIGMIELEEVLTEFNSALVCMIGIFEKILSTKTVALFEGDKELTEDLLIDSRQSLDMCQTTIKTIINVRSAYSAILTNNLNKVIKFLTSLTALLAIPTIIASLWGMNVPVPFADHPLAFTGIIVVTVALVAPIVVYFYRKNWL